MIAVAVFVLAVGLGALTQQQAGARAAAADTFGVAWPACGAWLLMLVHARAGGMEQSSAVSRTRNGVTPALCSCRCRLQRRRLRLWSSSRACQSTQLPLRLSCERLSKHAGDSAAA